MSHQRTPHPTLFAIAELIHQLRPDWDKPGLLTHLDTARLRVSVTPADLAIAAVKAADNPANRTPAVIPLDGEHWREHNRPLTTPQPPPMCKTCHQPHDPQHCPGPIRRVDHGPALAAIRDAYDKAMAGCCPHGVPWRNCHQHDGHVIAGEVIKETA
jgi:hypothetical protein